MNVNQLQIFASQRYSFILETNQPVDNYWIRANPNLGSQGFANGINSAILRYAGAPIADPTTNQSTTVNLLQETSLSPLKNPGAPGKPFPGGADINLNFNITFNVTDLHFEINGAPFIPPTVPVLLQILSGARTPQELLPPGSVYVLPPNKSVEVSIPGGSPGSPVSIVRNSCKAIMLTFCNTASYSLAWSEFPVSKSSIVNFNTVFSKHLMSFEVLEARPTIMLTL